MDATEYADWVKKLPQLSAEQQSDTLTRMKLLGVSASSSGKKEPGDRVVSAICDEFRRLGVEHPSPTVLKKSTAYASSKPKFESVLSFLEGASKQRIVQDALLKHAIDLLYHDLLQWNVPITAHTLISQIHRIPGTLNRHYPGYAQSGLLSKVVNVRAESDHGRKVLQRRR